MHSYLELWQQRLNLTDWVIELVEECSYLNENAGHTEWTETAKTAVIRILSKDSYGERLKQYDPEVILVHELLHLKFSLIWKTGNTLHDRVLHQIIEELSCTLVQLRREGNSNE